MKIRFPRLRGTAATGQTIAVYKMLWPDSPTGPIPTECNLLLLAFAGDDGRLPSAGGPQGRAATRKDADTVRSRGGQVGVSFGGEGYPLTLSEPGKLVAGLRHTISQVGPVNRIDWDMESKLPAVATIKRAQDAIRQEWPGMTFSVAPGGGVIDRWYEMLPELGVDAVYHQFYDYPHISDADIIRRIKQAKGAGVQEVGIGMKIQYRGVDEWEDTVRVVHMTYPSVRHAFLWEVGDLQTGDWAKRMRKVL